MRGLPKYLGIMQNLLVPVTIHMYRQLYIKTYSALTGTIHKAHELRDVWSKAGVLAADKSIFTKLSGNKTCVDCTENVYIVQGN